MRRATPCRREATSVNAAVPYGSFRRVFEGNPHGQAHVSFGGYISQIGTAARDPLFFLLHANVDRLWAKWQWFQQRFDATSARPTACRAAPRPGPHRSATSRWTPCGRGTTCAAHRGRNRTAHAVPGVAAGHRARAAHRPSADLLDYQGLLDETRRLGFDYDDVPFET